MHVKALDVGTESIDLAHVVTQFFVTGITV